MNKKYFDILSTITADNRKSLSLNSRVLLIDGLNQFIRAHAASPVTSENGYHVGGLSGFLLSIGYAIQNINPTRIIIAFDGKDGSQRRRKLFPAYKAGRRVSTNIINEAFYSTKAEEQASMSAQLSRLLDYLALLPVQVAVIDKIEADDTIAYLTKYFKKKYDSVVYIMSTDQDYYQLIDEHVTIWSPTKKRFYTQATIIDEYEGLSSSNHILYKSLIGDSSDEIPGIKGMGLKTMKKRLPFLFEPTAPALSISDIIDYATIHKDTNKIYAVIIAQQAQLELNYKLMQLADVDISATIKETIVNIVEQPINALIKFKFISMLVADGLNTIIKNPDMWLQSHFSKVHNFATV